MIKHCPRCSNAVEMKTLERVSEDAPLKLTVTGMPAAKCAKGHAAPIDRDFMLWLIHELKTRGGAPPAAKRRDGLQKVHLRCGKELESKSEKRKSFPLDLAYRAPRVQGRARHAGLQVHRLRSSCARPRNCKATPRRRSPRSTMRPDFPRLAAEDLAALIPDGALIAMPADYSLPAMAVVRALIIQKKKT